MAQTGVISSMLNLNQHGNQSNTAMREKLFLKGNVVLISNRSFQLRWVFKLPIYTKTLSVQCVAGNNIISAL